MKRAIVLQSEATHSKRRSLKKFSLEACKLANFLLSKRKSKKLMDLHKNWYLHCKQLTSFGSQVICDIERRVVKSTAKKLNAITVKFNVPRNCKVFSKSKFFIKLGLKAGYSISVPIRQNRNFQRYSSLLENDWVCKTYGITPNGEIIAYLSKDKDIKSRKNVLGIDINARHFAVSVLAPRGKVLYQTYFGRHIWAKRKKIMERRAFLQSINAKRALVKLRARELHFVKTNLGQVILEIMKLAKRFDADIAIEKIKKFKPLGRKSNNSIMRIPFYKFKKILQSRCFDNDVILNIVDSWHTSKWCSRCGAVGEGHSANYSLFKCSCGQVVNSDRKASLAIALKSLLERESGFIMPFFQFSNSRVPVNGLLRPYEVGMCKPAVQDTPQLKGNLCFKLG